MSETNIRMVRETYLARVRAQIADAQRALDKAQEAIVTVEDELRKRPNAPEGWVKESDYNPWESGPRTLQEAYHMTVDETIKYCQRGLSQADLEWAKKQTLAEYGDIMRWAGRGP